MLTSKFQTLFLKQWMHISPRDYRYEQVLVVFDGGINEEPGSLVVFKKKSDPWVDLDLLYTMAATYFDNMWVQFFLAN